MNLSDKFSSRIIYVLFVFILLIAAFLRFYRLDSVPPSLDWDEVDVGYNAYTIANWGKDEWGKTFPIVFTSFEDDKHPVHIYFTALIVKILGSSDFSTRFPSALFGFMNVIVIFFLARKMFKNQTIGLLSSFFLTLSPFNLQFSRFNHEANFALFFFMLGLLFFLKGLEKRNWLILVSLISFGISIIAYQSSEVVIPPILILLTVIYRKDLFKIKKFFLIGIVCLMLTLSLFLFDPRLLGGARIEQNQIPQENIVSTFSYKVTKSTILGEIEEVTDVYLQHFSPKYLFISGDTNPRHSIQGVGEFYWIDSVFLVSGLISLLYLRSKNVLILVTWVFLAPLPAALSTTEPHAARSLFMMGSWHIVASLGFVQIANLLRKPAIQVVFIGLFLVLLGYFVRNYLNDYYNVYPKKYAVEWQYGMKQAVEFIKSHSGYSPVYTTSIRHQPYAFFLYYLKTPEPIFHRDSEYNNSDSRGYSLVNRFGNYHFGDWNILDSQTNFLTLYVVTPYEYSGMRNKPLFDIKKVIKNPDGADAFYLVSYP